MKKNLLPIIDLEKKRRGKRKKVNKRIIYFHLNEILALTS